MTGGLKIQADRLLADLDALGRFGATERGGVDRPAFSDADLAARQWLQQRSAETGIGYRTDAIGNIFLSLPEQCLAPGAVTRPKIWTGSHIDTVPDGGRLDGAYGVMAGLECLRTLIDSNRRMQAPIEVVAFADEEGAYGGFLGSRALIQGLEAEEVHDLTGRDGSPLADGLARIGSSVEAVVAQAPLTAAEVGAFVELHIEQGPVLENAGVDIGVVTDIVEVAQGRITFRGQADHAGTTPMHLRRDATRAAGSFLVGLPQVAADHGSPTAVATCGLIAVEPGATNIVAESVALNLDVRDGAGRVPTLQAGVAALAQRCRDEHGLDFDLDWHILTAGVALNPTMQQKVANAADRLGVRHRSMPSGAGHDAQVMAPVIPTGMIFVPSAGGRSHSPVESTSPHHLEIGANVLLQVLADLAAERPAG
ncbi:MAG: Zn-dependent hydrolase [Acidimicrobiia bacterium]|nr:Zn-dependent hydrolase [Acidimicrobiia bacterium]